MNLVLPSGLSSHEEDGDGDDDHDDKNKDSDDENSDDNDDTADDDDDDDDDEDDIVVFVLDTTTTTPPTTTQRHTVIKSSSALSSLSFAAVSALLALSQTSAGSLASTRAPVAVPSGASRRHAGLRDGRVQRARGRCRAGGAVVALR